MFESSNYSEFQNFFQPALFMPKNLVPPIDDTQQPETMPQSRVSQVLNLGADLNLVNEEMEEIAEIQGSAYK